MNSRPQTRPSVLAFTLIELLTVITIIAILMGLLFPAIGIVKDSARKAEAKAAVAQIAASVKQYYTEYGKYPVADYVTSTPTDIKLGDQTKSGALDSNADLFNILRGRNVGRNVDNIFNPRRMSFFEHKPVGDPAAPKSGFLDSAGTGVVGAFYDPWGRQYTICIDANYNDVINIGSTYADFTESSQEGSDTGVRVGVGVFSLGKDADIGSPKATPPVTGRYRQGSNISDDILSWQ
jgi:prepilin-type N-terminal cleavage/methylation domain-containing protein